MIGFCADDGSLQAVAAAGGGALVAIGAEVSAAPLAELTGEAGIACTLRAPGLYELTLEAADDPVQLDRDTRVWICRAHGEVAGNAREGVATITRIEGDDGPLARAVSLSLGEDLAMLLHATRPSGSTGHGDERLAAAILRGAPATATLVEKPRLSTTYDAAGRPTHLGVELWETAEAEFPTRAGGEAVAHGELEHANGARTLVTFLDCHGEGRRGQGRYELAVN